MPAPRKDPETRTEVKLPWLGGLLGAILGWILECTSVQLLATLHYGNNLLLLLVALIWSIVNLAGLLAFPALGWWVGVRYGFTVTRTRYRR